MNVASLALFRSQYSAYESERAGAGRGVFFKGFLPCIFRAWRSVYPDWAIEVRHDERVTEWPYWKVVQELERRHALRLIFMGPSQTLCGSMLWRLYPMFESSTEVVMCRDVDSLPTPREQKAVQRWLGSGKALHSMQDSISHRSARIMGGMLTFRVDALRALFPTREALEKAIAESGIDMTKHGADQAFLWRTLKPLDERGELIVDTPETLGDRLKSEDPRDTCGGHAVHLGGAFHAGPAAAWYRLHFPDPLVSECEDAVGWRPE